MLMLEPVIRSVLLIMQLTEFMGANHLCFLVEDKDDFVDKNLQLLTDLQINSAKLATCKE
jgi:hypothetical protein